MTLPLLSLYHFSVSSKAELKMSEGVAIDWCLLVGLSVALFLVDYFILSVSTRIGLYLIAGWLEMQLGSWFAFFYGGIILSALIGLFKPRRVESKTYLLGSVGISGILMIIGMILFGEADGYSLVIITGSLILLFLLIPMFLVHGVTDYGSKIFIMLVIVIGLAVGYRAFGSISGSVSYIDI